MSFFCFFLFQVLAKLICYKGPATVTTVTVMWCDAFNFLESELLGTTDSRLQLTTGYLFSHFGLEVVKSQVLTLEEVAIVQK